jgi:hypothetical protein
MSGERRTCPNALSTLTAAAAAFLSKSVSEGVVTMATDRIAKENARLAEFHPWKVERSERIGPFSITPPIGPGWYFRFNYQEYGPFFEKDYACETWRRVVQIAYYGEQSRRQL